MTPLRIQGLRMYIKKDNKIIQPNYSFVYRTEVQNFYDKGTDIEYIPLIRLGKKIFPDFTIVQ